jgi:hypoxanthine phosphoribosyltransferase
MIESAAIRSVVKQLASELSATLNGRRPVLICTLKGACQFYVHFLDELQKLRQGYDVEFVRASSYDGRSTTGTVKMMGELNLDTLYGRHVIIVEDIVDTGTTLSTLVPYLFELGKPSAVEVVTLLDKRLESYKKKFRARFIGFSIPNHFIIGYG